MHELSPPIAGARPPPSRVLPAQWWVTLAALLGFLHWFFGNLYEAVVFSPNWVQDSPAQMQRLHGFFVSTGPTLYFVPITVLATLAVWLLPLWRPIEAARAPHRRAALLAMLAMGVNVLVVSTIIPRLFGADYLEHAAELEAYCWRWNVLNVVRMTLVGATCAQLFAALRAWDRDGAAQSRTSASPDDAATRAGPGSTPKHAIRPTARGSADPARAHRAGTAARDAS